MQYAPAIAPFMVSTAILAMLAVYGWLFRHSLAAVAFGFGMLLATANSLTYALHLTVAGGEAKILWLQLTVAGSGYLPLVLLAVALAYTGHAGWLTRARLLAFLAVPTVNVAMVMTSRLHGLSLTGFRLVPSALATGMVFSAGPWEIVSIAHSYTLLVASLAVLLGSGGQLDRARRHGARLMAAALCATSVLHALFRLGVTPIPGVNYTPAALALTGAAMAVALFRVRLLDVSPVASRTLIETMDSLVVVVDTRGRLVDGNPAARLAMGIDPAAHLGQSVGSLPPPWSDLLRDLPAAGAARDEVTLPDVGGGERAFLASSEPLRNRRGRCLGWLVVLYDVTERKSVEAALRESEETFRSFVEQSSEAIILTDEGGLVTEFNRSAERITGLRRDAVLGRPVWEVQSSVAPAELRADERVRKTRMMERRALEDGSWPFPSSWTESVVERPDGTRRIVEQIAFPVRTARGFRLAGLLHDVTAREETEEALRSSRRQLEQAQKMEAVGRLAGGIAHDFNNLLTVIGGYCELAMAETDPGHPARAGIVEIRRAAERAAALTRQLLAFSRRQLLKPQLMDLAGRVRSVAGMLERVIGEDVRLVLALDPQPSTVLADSHQIDQVVMNLAVNARDAMPRGGTLTISTGRRRVAEGLDPDHPEMRPGEYAVLTVSDTGSGMSAEVLAHLFEPFYTTKEPGKGTGLGLPTAYGIVKQSDGFIYGSNRPGGGAEFTVYLPLVAETPTARPAAAERPGRSGRGETLLLVEDEPSVRSYARAVLESAGYVVLEAEDARRALDVFEERPARPQLLVTDVVMPGMSGRELADLLVAASPGLRVLYVSGYTEDETLRHGAAGGNAAFLAKPYDAAALLGSVRRLLDGDGGGDGPAST